MHGEAMSTLLLGSPRISALEQSIEPLLKVMMMFASELGMYPRTENKYLGFESPRTRSQEQGRS